MIEYIKFPGTLGERKAIILQRVPINFAKRVYDTLI